MKKFMTILLLINIIYLSFSSNCMALVKDNVTLSAEFDNTNIQGEIDKRILKKYIPIKLTIKNKNNTEISIPNKVYYITDSNKIYLIPSSNIILDKTKLHTIRRAFAWGIPVTICTFFIFTIPAVGLSIASSISTNGTLENQIKKNNFNARHLFEDDIYSTYIFIPKKDSKVKSIILKDISADNSDNFDLKTDILNTSL